MLTGRLDSPALALAIRCGHFKNKTYKKWSLQGHRDQEVSLLLFVFCSARNGNWGFVYAGQVLAHLAVIASPQSTGFCTFLFYFVLLNPSLRTLHPLDAAFLAREKAKADAECYTALKIAEANKVKTWPPHWGSDWAPCSLPRPHNSSEKPCAVRDRHFSQQEAVGEVSFLC